MWKMKRILLFSNFTLKIYDWGDLFSISWTPYLSKFLPNSVNYDQDWMAIKFNPNLMNKLHPNYYLHHCNYIHIISPGDSNQLSLVSHDGEIRKVNPPRALDDLLSSSEHVHISTNPIILSQMQTREGYLVSWFSFCKL